MYSLSSVKDSKKIHILHVDDDASFLEVTKQILSLESDFTVESAVSADEGIKKLSKNVYDIVVSDFEMPQKDGLIFLKEIREQNNPIPFILFTGKGREEVAIKALNMGANGYYNKQGSPETVYGELIHGIKLCVELKRSEDLNKLVEARFSAAFNLNSVALCISDFETGLFVDCNEQFVNLFGYSREELIGRQSALILYVNPIDRQQILDLLTKNRQLLNYEVNLKNKNGKLITTLFSAKLIEVKNQIQILTTILNISESKQMKEKLKTFAQLQATVAELGQYALTQPAIDDFLDKVVNEVASALDVELCKVLEFLPGGEELLLRAGVGWKKGLVGKATVDTGDNSQAGYTLKSKTPIIVDDLRIEKRFSGPALLHNHSVISGLSVIIGSLEKPFGVLGVHTTHHQQFTKDDVNFMLAIANLIDAFIKLKNDKLELRKNELKFRTIADFGSDWVYWISPEGKLIYVSPSCEVITGYTANEFIDNPCLMRDIVVSEDKLVFGNHFDLFSSNNDHKLTFRIKTKTGQIRWIAHICQPVLDDSGKWLGRRATNMDITDLKMAEKQLRVSERRWAVTLSSIGDGVVAVDVLGKVSFLNSVAEELTGWTLSEAAGKPLSQVFNIINEKSRLPVQSPVEKVLCEGVVVGLANHTVLLRKDGTEVPIDDSAAPIRDDEGNITGVVLVFRDITKRKKTEETLTESETKYRRLLDGMTDTAWVIDDECNIIDVNRSASELLGYTKKELLKMNLTDIDDNLKAEKIRHLVKTMPKDKIQVFETVHTTKNGDKIPVEISSSLVTYKGKQAILSIARNITERKKTESTLYLNKILLEYLLAINKMEEASKKELIDFALEAIIKVTQSKFALISLVNDDQTILTIQAWSKNVMKECKTTQKPTDYNLSQAGIWAEPIRQRKTIFIEDYNAANLKKRGLPEGHVKIKNYLGVPIFEKDTAVAMAAVANKNGFYTENDALTISSVMNDTWRIIQRKNFESEREQNLSKLSMLNEKLNVVGSLTRHDVRNKLMAIKAKTYLLKKKNIDNAELIRNLEGVETTVDSAAALLAFSGLYEKIGAEELREINVEECFNQALALRRSVQNIKIINETRGLTVIADKLLSEVFYNLLDNSLRHGQRVTQIRLFTIKDNDKLKLIYEDNGVGVSEENKDKIFVGGFSTGRSSGLGLKLIKRVIEGYGWSIVENGEPNKGAKFTITIPQTTQE